MLRRNLLVPPAVLEESAMETFHMTDIISILGLPYPMRGQNSYYVRCPCCDDNPYKKHLNINLQKDVFRCPRCGVSGGIFDLYSLYTGIPRGDVFKALTERIRSPKLVERPKIQIPPQEESEDECPITDVESRHATYSALLDKLTLAKDHRENLLGRGLSEDNVARLGYKTTPVVGMTSIAKLLQADGKYLAGVPGFYRMESGDWTFVRESRGILIPVRDKSGLIQGLQIRLDNVQRRKFRWISSAERKDGCKAEGWVHIAGDIGAKMILTEGPMKADVIHALSGHSVIAVPGVNSLLHLKPVLEDLRKCGLTEIKTAFDMDFSTNRHVQDGLRNLLALLDEMNFRFGTYVWDPRYKGLDDYIWEKTKN